MIWLVIYLLVACLFAFISHSVNKGSKPFSFILAVGILWPLMLVFLVIVASRKKPSE
jgi:hypothetical protein